MSNIGTRNCATNSSARASGNFTSEVQMPLMGSIGNLSLQTSESPEQKELTSSAVTGTLNNLNFGTLHHCKCLLEGHEVHGECAISTPHGAAATARLLSPHRTALQPQRVCYLHTTRRCRRSGEARNTRPLRGEAYKAKP